MPEFTESEIISDGNGKSAANESATANESAASSQNSNRPRRQRRRNPILSNARAKSLAPAPIGPCEVNCQCQDEVDGERKECECVSQDRKYSTQVIHDQQDSRESKPAQFRRKPGQRPGPNGNQREYPAAKSENGPRSCTCIGCSFMRKVLNVIWPFGKKQQCEGNASSSMAQRPSGGGRRPRSEGNSQRNGGNSRGGSPRRSNRPRT